MAELPVRKIWGIGAVAEQKLERLGISTCGNCSVSSRAELSEHFRKIWCSSFMIFARGIDERPVEPDRERKSLSNEETFATNLETLAECEEKLPELFEELMAELAQKEHTSNDDKDFREAEVQRFPARRWNAPGCRPRSRISVSSLRKASPGLARACVCSASACVLQVRPQTKRSSRCSD